MAVEALRYAGGVAVGRMAVVVRVEVSPAVIAWATERSGIDRDRLAQRFPLLREWEQHRSAPTLRQLEQFARATHTSVGLLFLDEPPVESVPIPDYRTIGSAGIPEPSADLLDTIFRCQQRQDWYRSFAQVNQQSPVAFVGSLSASTPFQMLRVERARFVLGR
jgi:hypothetical protein